MAKAKKSGPAIFMYSVIALGLLISAVTVVTMLFADELFRLGLIFRVRNVEQVEPSDWEFFSRYVGWTVLTVTAFVIYITGLQ